MAQKGRPLCSIFLTSAATGTGSWKPRGSVKLCSVPVTPDPSFTPQGRLLFSRLRSQARPSPGPFSPQGGKASPLPGGRPGESRSVRPPTRQPHAHLGRGPAPLGACFLSPGAAPSPGGGGRFLGPPPSVSSGVGAQTTPAGAVASGLWSPWVLGLQGPVNKAIGRELVSPALQVGEGQAGRPRARTPGEHPCRMRQRKGQRVLAMKWGPHMQEATSSMSGVNEDHRLWRPGLLLASCDPHRACTFPARTMRSQLAPTLGLRDSRGLRMHQGDRLGAQVMGTGVTWSGGAGRGLPPLSSLLSGPCAVGSLCWVTTWPRYTHAVHSEGCSERGGE